MGLFIHELLIVVSIVALIFIGLLALALMKASKTNWTGERIITNQKQPKEKRMLMEK